MCVTHDPKAAARCSRVLYIMDSGIVGEKDMGHFDSSGKELRDRERELNIYDRYSDCGGRKGTGGLATDFLREEGYVVSSVNSGVRAVHLFERYGAVLYCPISDKISGSPQNSCGLPLILYYLTRIQ